MARAAKQQVEDAARAVLIEGERVTSTGECWAVQARSRMPLAFLARRQYLMALTDRRVLVFTRRRRGPQASDLIIGKRYETFTLGRVKRRRPLVQVAVHASSGNRLVFEFRRRQRELAGELIARLTPAPPSHAADDTKAAPAIVPILSDEELADDYEMMAFDGKTDDDEATDDTAFWGSRS